MKQQARQAVGPLDGAEDPEKQPMLQYTTPENIGALAVFLAGDAAATITRSSYSIDGGWTAQ